MRALERPSGLLSAVAWSGVLKARRISVAMAWPRASSYSCLRGGGLRWQLRQRGAELYRQGAAGTSPRLGLAIGTHSPPAHAQLQAATTCTIWMGWLHATKPCWH